MARRALDTQVPAEGAEHLVQGMLCRWGVPTFKAPAFRAIYDLVAINPITKASATIQVKSRFQTDCDRGFTIRAERKGADFYVFVFLNMGKWYGNKPNEGIADPEFYVLPNKEVAKRVDFDRKMPKLFIRSGDNEMCRFRDAWHLIVAYIELDREAILRGEAVATIEGRQRALDHLFAQDLDFGSWEEAKQQIQNEVVKQLEAS